MYKCYQEYTTNEQMLSAVDSKGTNAISSR